MSRLRHSFGSTRFGKTRNHFTRQGNRFHPKHGSPNKSRNGIKFDVSLLVKKAETSAPDEYQTQHTFQDFPINETLKQNISNRRYTTPTPIQNQAIPYLLAGRDVVGIANTGTGKTAAFLVPLIDKVSKNRYEKVLIVAPTRELAGQIQQDCNSFASGLNIRSLLCIGGVGINPQIQGLRQNPSIVIGTPGRLKDLKNQGKLNLSLYTNVVLDEVDRMLDIGFIHDIKFLISHLPQKRQSLFFSATLDRETESVMRSFLQDPVHISVKKQETPHNVDQDIVKVNGQVKFEVLCSLLFQDGFEKVLVFGRTKWGVEKLARQLAGRGLRVASIHGNKSQGQRQRAIEEFKRSKINVLLATDIASRGLDIKDVTHVINYDLPQTYEDYIHRIGRTGRANKKGTALSFVD